MTQMQHSTNVTLYLPMTFEEIDYYKNAKFINLMNFSVFRHLRNISVVFTSEVFDFKKHGFACFATQVRLKHLNYWKIGNFIQTNTVLAARSGHFLACLASLFKTQGCLMDFCRPVLTSQHVK